MYLPGPNFDLHLEWVYGFRSEKCRNNVRSISGSEIVYFVESLGVIFNIKCRQQRFYFGHTENILSLAVHPLKYFVATGQMGTRPYICIWDPMTMETVSILKNGHSLGISAIDFNSDGKKLASVGFGQNSSIIIWDWKAGRVLTKFEDQNFHQIFFIRFSPFECGRLITGGIKSFNFYKLSDSNYLEKKCPQDWETIAGVDAQTMLCAIFSSNGLIFSGSLSGDIYVWKSESLDSVMKNVHRGGVTVINCDEDGTFLTAGKDGHVQLWTIDMKPKSRIDLSVYTKGLKGVQIRVAEFGKFSVLVGTSENKIYEVQSQPQYNIECILQGPSASGESQALAMHPQRLLFVDGTKDGMLRLWTVFERNLLNEINVGVGINCCHFRPQGNHLAVGTSKAGIIIHRFPDLDIVLTIRDLIDNLWVLKYSPDGIYLAAGKSDGCIIYNVYKNYAKVNDITGCKAPPLHFDWSSNSDYIQIVDVNYQHYVFRAHDGRLINEDNEINKLMWSSWTCPVGPEIAGVWPKYSQDFKYVIAVDVNLETNLAITGHKKGQLQLHTFPKHEFGESRIVHTGHSSKIANIQFVHDKSRVISVAGNGKAIFQWTVCGQNIRNNVYQVEFISNYDIRNDIVEEEFTLDCEIAREIQLFHQCIQNQSNKKIIKDFINKKGRDGFRKPPNEGLQLQYAFGNRLYDCRNNLFFSSIGKIVYHLAAVGVVLSSIENKQQFYFGHTDDIICICISPVNDVVATGQLGTQIHVWDVKSLLTVSILEESDNCKAILGISFSRNGIYLLSRSIYKDGQKLTIWDWQTGQILAQSEFVYECLMMASWHSTNERKLVSVGVGHLRFWIRLGNGFTYREVKFDGKTISKTEILLCAASLLSNPDEDHYITGSSSGNFYEWKNCILLKVIKAHDGPVFCLNILENGFISGGKDGVVHLWDDHLQHAIRTFPVLKSYAICKGSNRVYMCKDRPAIKACDMRQGTIVIGTADGDIILMENNGYFTVLNQIHPAHKINGIDVHPFSNKLVTYGEDMTIRTWDLDSYQLITCKAMFRLGNCVAYSTDGVFIAAGHSDGSVEILNSNSLDTLEIIHNKTSAVVNMKFSPKPNGFLAIAHEDGFVDVFTSNCPWRWKNTCDSKNILITRLNWDEKGNLLFIFDTSGNRLAYEIPSGIEVIFPLSNSQQPAFNSILCTKEFPNCKWDLAHNFKLIAIAHKSSILKLMSGPTKAIDSANKLYNGHGHIGDLKWTYNDGILVTVNNSGAAILLWNQNISTSERKINYDSDESDNERPDEDIDSEIDEEMNAIQIYKQQRFEEILKSKKFTERVSNGDREKLTIEKEWKKSCQVPKLQLEFAFGYNGKGFGNNLHYLATNETIVYPVSSTAVIFNIVTNSQSYYDKHTDCITALVVNHHLNYTGIVASAQLTNEPAVHVWSHKTLQNVSMLFASTIKSKKSHSGFRSLCFSESGLLLLGLEYNSSILVWKWTEGNLIIKTEAITKSCIFDIKFRPNSNHEMVSVGKRHVKFWTIAGCKLISRKGVDTIIQECNESTRMQTMLSVSFGKGDIAFTGGVDGKIYEWKKFFLQRVIVEAHAGPIFTMHLSLYDGLLISGSKIVSNNSVGDENVLKMWDSYMTKCKPFCIGENVVVKAVDRFMGKLLIGTNDNCIYELSEKTGTVHKILNSCIGKIYNAVCHPKQSIVATIDESKTLRIWDIKRRKMKRKLKLNHEVKCLDFDSEGEIIVLGSSEGHIYIVDAMTMSTIYQKRDYVFPMKSIRVSSENLYLANLFDDGTVNIYIESERWKHLKRVGYWSSEDSTAIGYARIDFSKDSKYLAIFRHNITDILVLSLPSGYKVANIFLNEWINQTFSLVKLLEKHWLAFIKGDNCHTFTCLAMSKDKSLLAVGTNKGKVGFIPFPITKFEILWNKSHYSVIGGLDFLYDKTSAVTVSTNCMKVWSLMFDLA